MKIYAKVLLIKMMQARTAFDFSIMFVGQDEKQYESHGIIGDGNGNITIIYYTKIQDNNPLEFEKKDFCLKHDMREISRELAKISEKGWLEIMATPDASDEEDGIFREDIIC